MIKVLLASDGSACAEEAAWFLSHLPHAQKVELYVLTVLQIPYSNHRYASPSSITESVDRERASALEAFKRIAAMFEGADVIVKHITREGHRGQNIVEVSDSLEVDLTVVGARGHSTVRRLLLGSTSDYVATQARSSVLVVRPTGLKEASRPIRIAIGYDESDPAKAALREFSETQWGNNSDVHLVSVVSYVSAFLNEMIVEADEIKASATLAINSAADQLRSAAPSVQSHVVESDHVGEGLTEFVEEKHCDLIVIGETPHSALGRVVLGSVSRFVLRHAPCSVWITRSHRHEKAGDEKDRSTEAAS